MHTRPDGWWHRLGGPNAVTLAAWWLTLPGGVLAAFTWLPRDVEVRPLAVVAAAVAGHLLTGAFLLVAWATYLSPRPRPSRPAALVLTLLVAGACRGAALAVTWRAAGLTDTAPIGGRALGAAVSVAVWFSLATLIVDASRRHRTLAAGLRRTLQREQLLALQSAEAGRALRASLVARCRELVDLQLSDQVLLAGDGPAAAVHLARLSDDVIRPLSHEVARRSEGDLRLVAELDRVAEVPRPNLASYAVGVVTDRPFAPLATAVIVTSTSMTVTMAVMGVGTGLLILATTFAILLGGLSLARTLVAARLPALSLARRIAAVATAWCLVCLAFAVTVLGIVVVARPRPDIWLATTVIPPALAGLLATLAITSLTMLTVAVEGSIQARRHDTEVELDVAARAAVWAESRLRQQVWSERRLVARALHGGVQSRIMAAALRLRQDPAADVGTTIVALSHEIEDALHLPPPTGWHQALADVTEVWHGAVDLDVSIHAAASLALDHDPVAGQAVVAVIGEATANAVRHGDAGVVSVLLSNAEGVVRVVVTDDGTPVAPRGDPGLGSGLLDEVCLDWRLDLGPATVLTARIPCAGPRTSAAAVP